MNEAITYTVFSGDRHLTTDSLKQMLLTTKEYIDREREAQVLIFEDQTGHQIDFDFRGTPDEVLEKLKFHPLFVPEPDKEKSRVGPGRPRLGVLCREVCLLPRHWDWLESQPGGSSAVLRRLVDAARKQIPEKDEVGASRDAAGKFMLVMAGNLPNFEEVTRALYAGKYDLTKPLMQDWPRDIRAHAERLIQRCINAEEKTSQIGRRLP